MSFALKAVDDDDGMHDVGRYELNMELQVHGLSAHPEKWDEKLKANIKVLICSKCANVAQPHMHESNFGGMIVGRT